MSETPRRPIQPVAPSGMDLIFYYRCPSCNRKIGLRAPTQPGMLACDACGIAFPAIPVDERTIHFLRIMLADGRAAADADFL